MQTALLTGGSGFIGGHMIELLLARGYRVVNVDLDPPRVSEGHSWIRGSIMDRGSFNSIVQEVRPEHVVHLAAYASMEAKSLDEFRVNIEGTANVVGAVRSCPAVRRLIVTSSQHVRKPGAGIPVNESDYVPYEYYGESKVRTEQITREANLGCTWTIVRPTAVWGPHQPPLAEGVWKILKRGLYLHPANDPVFRSYGYVKNVVWQIERLLQIPAELVNGRMFYVGDENIRQYEWINGFARALTGRSVRTVPLGVIRGLAQLGDALRAMGLRFPIYGSRLHNLTMPNPVPIGHTFDLLGRPPFSLEDGIRQTAEWLHEYYTECSDSSR